MKTNILKSLSGGVFFALFLSSVASANEIENSNIQSYLLASNLTATTGTATLIGQECSRGVDVKFPSTYSPVPGEPNFSYLAPLNSTANGPCSSGCSGNGPTSTVIHTIQSSNPVQVNSSTKELYGKYFSNTGGLVIKYKDTIGAGSLKGCTKCTVYNLQFFKCTK